MLPYFGFHYGSQFFLSIINKILKLAFLIFLIIGASSLITNLKADTKNDNFANAVKAFNEKNYSSAVRLFEIEAQNFDFEAQYNLALLLKSGKGRPQDYSSALFWSRIAQLSGLEQAKELADEITEKISEKEIEPIINKISKTIINRIDKGDTSAIPLLAAFYRDLLEETDFENAYIWYSIAVAFDIPETIKPRDEMEEKIEKDQLLKLQSKSNEIFKKINDGKTISK